MLIIPTVDIAGGRCVQLVGGRINSASEYGDPVDWARRWCDEGAELLHVVDLDAALGLGDNTEKVVEIVRAVDVPVQVGGGIRSLDRVSVLISEGVERIVVGTVAVKNPELLDKMIDLAGAKRIVVAIDSKGGRVVIDGWREPVQLTPIEAARIFAKKGIWGFLYTMVDVEGTMAGVRPDDIRSVVSATPLPVLVSGGIGNLEDLRKLKACGVYGAVVGKALYERRFSLREAMEVVSR